MPFPLYDTEVAFTIFSGCGRLFEFSSSSWYELYVKF
jgi:hypothetical protein